MISATEEIEELLLKVKDYESAQAAVPAMQSHQNRVRALLLKLEDAPTDISTNRIITRTMMTLMHITQRYMPVVLRLETENAYGSESLLAMLRVLGSDDPYGENEESPSVPAVQPHEVYTALCRHLNEVLYELRKTTDSYSARNTAAVLRQWQPEHRRLCEQWNSLPPAVLAEQIADQEKLSSLKAELAAEIGRLRKATCFDDPDLPSLLSPYAAMP